MESKWRSAARRFIAQLMAEHLPADAPLKDRRLLLRNHANIFHGGTSHGRKIWWQESRAYLEQHGLPKRKPSATLPLFGRSAP